MPQVQLLSRRLPRLHIEHLEERLLMAVFTVEAGAIDGAEGSLRAAVIAANGNGEDDEILLSAGVHRLELAGAEENAAATGDLDLGELGTTITIRGAGPGVTFLDADSLADRLFEVGEGVTAIFIGVTLRGGRADDGGALFNAGTVELHDVRITGNEALHGGGIYNVGALNINRSDVDHNLARAEGGGIFNAGHLALFESAVEDNSAPAGDADLFTPSVPDYSTIDVDIRLPITAIIDTTGYVLGDVWHDWGDVLTSDYILAGEGGSIRSVGGGSGSGGGGFQPGSLTAGSIDDLADFAAFQEFLSAAHASLGQQYPEFNVADAATIQIRDAAGASVLDANVEVYALASPVDDPAGAPLVSFRTAADGRALFLPEHDGGELADYYAVVVTRPDGSDPTTHVFARGNAQWEITLAGEFAKLPTQLDLAFVIDATGSMSDELEFLKIEIDSIVAATAASHPDVHIRFSLVVYRDQGDEYVTRSYAFTDSLAEFRTLLGQQSAGGGGDYPEAMHLALEESLKFDWRAENTARMLFLVADAPPHDEFAARTLAAAAQLRDEGVRVFPVASSGVADKAEYVMRTSAFLTQGKYLFLTDHSGYGNSHAQPNVDEYDVERLDQLMIRIIDSELSGTVVPAEEIIEHVVVDPSIVDQLFADDDWTAPVARSVMATAAVPDRLLCLLGRGDSPNNLSASEEISVGRTQGAEESGALAPELLSLSRFSALQAGSLTEHAAAI